jgi:hypothetical protein
MLGYALPNSDVYVYYEADEVERQASGTIQGVYFNLNALEIIGLLETSIDDKISDEIVTSIKRNETSLVMSLHLQMKLRKYLELKEKGTAGVHEGYRHIELLDANRLSVSDKSNYDQMKRLKIGNLAKEEKTEQKSD